VKVEIDAMHACEGGSDRRFHLIAAGLFGGVKKAEGDTQGVVVVQVAVGILRGGVAARRSGFSFAPVMPSNCAGAVLHKS